MKKLKIKSPKQLYKELEILNEIQESLDDQIECEVKQIMEETCEEIPQFEGTYESLDNLKLIK